MSQHESDKASQAMFSQQDEIAAVRKMLQEKRNKDTGVEDDTVKSVRIRSLDERIAMKKAKPWAIATMLSIHDSPEGATQVKELCEQARSNQQDEVAAVRKMLQEKTGMTTS